MCVCVSDCDKPGCQHAMAWRRTLSTFGVNYFNITCYDTVLMIYKRTVHTTKAPWLLIMYLLTDGHAMQTSYYCSLMTRVGQCAPQGRTTWISLLDSLRGGERHICTISLSHWGTQIVISCLRYFFPCKGFVQNFQTRQIRVDLMIILL